jgi:hypothetical protein
MVRKPVQVAEALRRYFEEGFEEPDLFTNPYLAWHCYDELDKIARPHSLKSGDGDPETNIVTKLFAGYARVRVYGGDASVTALLTTEVMRANGTTFNLHVCLVHFMDSEGRVNRVEAYYDPRELERDAWYRMHMLPYEGMPGSTTAA